ncbi:IS30 family transposase [Pseudonocardia xinjiangensis]|uniref:IS30 family transposase n=1 Tax=Pseudonocardia xinjiangensis TaxID=75289 RepID=UPI003D8C1AAD
MAVTGRPRVSRVRVWAFWRAWKAGAPLAAAVACAGVSETTGRHWVTQAGGVIPDLDEPSGRHLSLAEREEIAVGVAAGLSNAEIARRLGRHRSTIGRELTRNQMMWGDRPARARPARERAARARARAGHDPQPGRPGQSPTPGLAAGPGPARRRNLCYRAWVAQTKAEQRARRPKPTKLADNPALAARVQAELTARWSPEQIASRLRQDFPDQPELWVSHETIYQELYVQGRGQLRRELTRCLRTGRALRRPHRRADQRRERARITDMLMISERPAEAEDRAVPGHWEGDLIIGKDGGSAIGTLVERSTRFVMLLHLPDTHGAPQVRDAMITSMHSLPAALRRSLTWDQGIELSRHGEITIALDMPIYFCDPHSPWQRGSNENTNGLLRQYFPKGTDLSRHTAVELDLAAAEINARPRKTLGWDTPAEALARILSPPATTTGVARTP